MSSHASSPLRSSQLLLGLAAVVVVAAAKIALWVTWGGPQFIWDSYWYLSLSRSIHEMGHYTLGDGAFHTKYAPGLPLLLAMFGPALGSYGLAGGLLSLIASILVILAVFAIGRGINLRVGVLAAAIVAGHHLSLLHSNLVLTEQIFCLCMLAALLLAAKSRWSSCWGIAGVASLVRYEGLLLLGVLLVQRARNGIQRTELLAIGLVALVWATWAGILLNHADLGSGYLSELGKCEFSRSLDFLLLALWLGSFFLLLGIAGLPKLHRASPKFMKFAAPFSAAYFCLHLVWWFTDIRFYLPLIPLLSLAAGIVVDSLLKGIPTRAGRVVLCSLIAGALAYEQWAMLHPSEYEYRRYNVLYLTQYAPAQRAASWIDANLGGASLAVPELTVYGNLLPGHTLELSDHLLRPSNQKSRYLVLDNLHFNFEALNSALSGQVTLPDAAGNATAHSSKLLHIERGASTSDDTRFVAVLEILP